MRWNRWRIFFAGFWRESRKTGIRYELFPDFAEMFSTLDSHPLNL